MKNKTLLIIIGVILLGCILLACLCTLSGGLIYWFSSQSDWSGSSQSSLESSTPTPWVIRPTIPSPSLLTEIPTQGLQTTPAQITPSVISSSSPELVLKTLNDTTIPENNLIELAERLQGKKNISPTQPAPARFYQIGDQESFWVSNVDNNENFKVDTTLQYITDHAYFWVENGTPFKQKDLQELGDTFEKKIYPTDREFFGSEWTPGVDGDPHIYILYVQNAGSSIAGYFSSVDEYPPQAHQYSNWHETFVFNADNVNLRDNFTYGVLAHEFQHMIHWANDRNEDTWLNEGFSDLAMFLNGFDTGGHDRLFASEPDLQLNDWPNDQDQTPPHYGASFLFTTYFLDRFGEETTKALIHRPENGLASIDALMQEKGLRDSVTNRPIGADDIFLDWTLANYIHDPKVGDGRYTYSNYPNAPRVSDTETITSCGSEYQTRDVHQYGADYIRIRCQGNVTLRFEGSVQVGLLPEDPHSGNWAFWSNKGDESDMTLTKTFDFTNTQSPLTLQYWTWYDLEKDYDFVYLLASSDGQTWDMLHPAHGTDGNITGNNFGFGYNGLSGDGDQAQWIQESVDLSQYKGKKVQIRFEYVTDAAVNGEGFMLDDVSVPEVGYFDDFENGNGGWQNAGFVRVENILPQTFRLALIRHGSQTTVEYLDLNSDNSLEMPLDFNHDLHDVVLVVTGTTRYTRQPAAYRFYFLK